MKIVTDIQKIHPPSLNNSDKKMHSNAQKTVGNSRIKVTLTASGFEFRTPKYMYLISIAM